MVEHESRDYLEVVKDDFVQQTVTEPILEE